VLTAVATTVISFLPVFTMTGAEGKLFQPLAFTKTFALIASVIVALTIIPPVAHVLFAGRLTSRMLKQAFHVGLIVAGIIIGVWLAWWAGLMLVLLGAYQVAEDHLPKWLRGYAPWLASGAAVLAVGMLLTEEWLPLGPDKGLSRNLLFVAVLIGSLLLFFQIFQRFLYVPILRWCLANKALFLSIPTVLVFLGASVWLGFGTTFGWIPWSAEQVGLDRSFVEERTIWLSASEALPGLGKEFMPPLDEGAFLYMPTTMPHASIGEALDVLQFQDRRLASIPEIDSVVGKIGRVDSPLDPAPISMIETVINYKSEYLSNADGHQLRFRYDWDKGVYVRDKDGDLIEDPNGKPFRQWRDEIRSPDDIWKEITKAAEIPGTTSAPKLQPIAARIVMLQSGREYEIEVESCKPSPGFDMCILVKGNPTGNDRFESRKRWVIPRRRKGETVDIPLLIAELADDDVDLQALLAQ